VDWDKAKYGGLVMAGFVAGIAAITAVVGATGGVAAAVGGGVMLAFAGSIMMMAKAFEMFATPIKKLDGVNLDGLGTGLAELSLGVLAMMGVGGLGLLGGVALGLGGFAAVTMIEKIGKYAQTYADPISTLAEAMRVLADSLGRILTISDGVKELDLGGLAANVSKASLPQASGGKTIPLINHVRIDVDGRQIMRVVEESALRIA